MQQQDHSRRPRLSAENLDVGLSPTFYSGSFRRSTEPLTRPASATTSVMMTLLRPTRVQIPPHVGSLTTQLISLSHTMAVNAIANAAQAYLGDEPTSTKIQPKFRPNETMKALVWHGKKSVSVDEVPVPAVTDPTDVVLRVTGSSRTCSMMWRDVDVAQARPSASVHFSFSLRC